jgi:hypothetical protein
VKSFLSLDFPGSGIGTSGGRYLDASCWSYDGSIEALCFQNPNRHFTQKKPAAQINKNTIATIQSGGSSPKSLSMKPFILVTF